MFDNLSRGTLSTMSRLRTAAVGPVMDGSNWVWLTSISASGWCSIMGKLETDYKYMYSLLNWEFIRNNNTHVFNCLWDILRRGAINGGSCISLTALLLPQLLLCPLLRKFCCRPYTLSCVMCRLLVGSFSCGLQGFCWCWKIVRKKSHNNKRPSEVIGLSTLAVEFTLLRSSIAGDMAQMEYQDKSMWGSYFRWMNVECSTLLSIPRLQISLKFWKSDLIECGHCRYTECNQNTNCTYKQSRLGQASNKVENCDSLLISPCSFSWGHRACTYIPHYHLPPSMPSFAPLLSLKIPTLSDIEDESEKMQETTLSDTWIKRQENSQYLCTQIINGIDLLSRVSPTIEPLSGVLWPSNT